jgi:hypothetical protein
VGRHDCNLDETHTQPDRCASRCRRKMGLRFGDLCGQGLPRSADDGSHNRIVSASGNVDADDTKFRRATEVPAQDRADAALEYGIRDNPVKLDSEYARQQGSQRKTNRIASQKAAYALLGPRRKPAITSDNRRPKRPQKMRLESQRCWSVLKSTHLSPLRSLLSQRVSQPSRVAAPTRWRQLRRRLPCQRAVIEQQWPRQPRLRGR